MRLAIALLVPVAVAACGAPPAPGTAAPANDAATPDGGTRPQEGAYVEVIGTVQDGGLPHAACSCMRCERARHDPEARRYVASLALHVPGAKPVLFDATPDVHAQLDAVRSADAPTGRVDRAPVGGVFLTHAHIGHYTGLALFGYEAVHTRDLPVYCTPGMAAFLRENGPWDQLVRLGNIDLRPIDPGGTVRLEGGVEVTFVPVPHRDEYADTVAFLVRGPRGSVFYVPDTDTWDRWRPSLPERLRGVDVALIDGTFHSMDELPGRSLENVPHPLIEDSMDLLEPTVAAGTRVLFTHLNHSNPALDPSGTIDGIRERGFDVAREGMRFPI